MNIKTDNGMVGVMAFGSEPRNSIQFPLAGLWVSGKNPTVPDNAAAHTWAMKTRLERDHVETKTRRSLSDFGRSLALSMPLVGADVRRPIFDGPTGVQAGQAPFQLSVFSVSAFSPAPRSAFVLLAILCGQPDFRFQLSVFRKFSVLFVLSVVNPLSPTTAGT